MLLQADADTPAIRAETPRKPGICLLTETYYPVVGGGETQARVLAEDLVANGFPVMVVTRRSSSTLAKVERIGGVLVCRTSPVGGGQLKRWIMIFACVPALLSRRRQFDLIYVSGFKALGLTAVALSRLLRKRCVLKADSNGEMSGAFFDRGRQTLGLGSDSALFRSFLALRNSVLRRADRFLAISTDIASELQHHGIQPDAIELVTNSVDTNRFRPVSAGARAALRETLLLPADRIIVTFTGRLVSYKGLPLLLRVWEQVQRVHSRAMLLLVGAGGLDIHNCEAELKRQVQDSGLQRSVRFTGDVHNVHEYLQASDIFVFPTEKEAFGISLIEAMACGLPVIATPTGGIKDFLVDGQNGLLVEAGNFQQLCLAIDRLLTDASLAGVLGSAALATARARYARDVVLEQHIHLFDRLAGLRVTGSMDTEGIETAQQPTGMRLAMRRASDASD
jgi:glycosyltransferase involved in cell wall biosynthesis